MKFIFFNSFLILFLLCITCPSNAQRLDSLYKVYETKSTIEQKIPILEGIFAIETHQDFEKALPILDTLAAYYQQIGDIKGYNRTHYQYRVFLYSVHERYVEAIGYYQEYAKNHKPEEESDGYFLINVGNMYYTLKLFNMARKFYEEAEVLFKKLSNYKGLATTYGNYSLVAKNLQQPDTAFFYIQKALDIQQEFVKDTFQIAHIYHVIGRLYSETKKQYTEAIPYYQKAIDLLSLPQLKQSVYYQQFIHILPQSYMRLGKSYCQLQQADIGFLYLDTALHIAKEIGQQRAELEVLTTIAEEKTNLGQYETARSLLLEAEKIGLEINNQTLLLQCYEQLKNVHLQTQQAEIAVFYWTKYDSLQTLLKGDEDKFLVMNDQILQQERDNTIAEQTKSMEKDARNFRILLLFLLLIGFALLISFISIWIIRRKNKVIAAYAEQLKSANTVKDVLLMTIGHDLRSPFSSIMSNTATLSNQLKNKDLAQIQATTQQLAQASKTAYLMMDGLMQWAVLQKEQKVAQPEIFRLDLFLNDMIAQLQPIVEMSAVQITLQTPPCTLLSDPNMLKVIVRNLLTNAIKYSADEGQILINVQLQDQQIQLTIYNEGGQISETTLAALRDSQNYYDIAKKGSGLGLLLVKEFSEQLNIQFQIQNQGINGVLSSLFFPANALVEMQQLSEVQPIFEQEKNSVLTATEREELAPWLAQIRQHDIYESTAIKTILEQIPANSSENLLNWKKQLLQALYQMNEPLFIKLTS